MDTKRKEENFLNKFAKISFKLKIQLRQTWTTMQIPIPFSSYKIPDKRIDFGCEILCEMKMHDS